MIPSKLTSSICTLRCFLLLSEHLWSLWKKVPLWENFLSSCCFMFSIILNKTVIPYQSHITCLFSSDRMWYNSQGNACRYTYMNVTLVKYIVFAAHHVRRRGLSHQTVHNKISFVFYISLMLKAFGLITKYINALSCNFS